MVKREKETLSSESPFTIDFIVELNTKFRTIVTDQLDKRFKKAILTQQDPATMTIDEAATLRNTISIFVYGYIHGVLRGTRNLLLAEGRIIATILRREYPKLFNLRVNEDLSCSTLQRSHWRTAVHESTSGPVLAGKKHCL
jgi:hypothetical protein